MREKYTDWLKDQKWIRPDDCVYVVSNILELAKSAKEQGRKLELGKLIDDLQELVGETGTLLFPTFNWDFCKGVCFDSEKTPTRTGALSKEALIRKDFARTTHPLYSFAVWGARKEELLQNDSIDSFGRGTIFESLYQWEAKVLVIGMAALAGVSYIHHVEQMVGVPYRYHKEFTADYKNTLGTYEKRTYRMYVRDLQMDPRHIDGFRPLEERMRKEGLIQTKYYGNIPSHLVLVKDLDIAVRRDILENDSRNMYFYHKVKSESSEGDS